MTKSKENLFRRSRRIFRREAARRGRNIEKRLAFGFISDIKSAWRCCDRLINNLFNNGGGAYRAFYLLGSICGKINEIFPNAPDDEKLDASRSDGLEAQWAGSGAHEA